MENEYVLGIDLGTTYTCVGVFIDGKVEFILNKNGNKTTPSIVYLDKTNNFVGDEAKKRLINNPSNTIYNIKRLIGKNFLDETIQNNMDQFKYQILCKNDKPCVSIPYGNVNKEFYPEEISAMILKEMKGLSEEHFKCILCNFIQYNILLLCFIRIIYFIFNVVIIKYDRKNY